jgi:hypothetical protein
MLARVGSVGALIKYAKKMGWLHKLNLSVLTWMIITHSNRIESNQNQNQNQNETDYRLNSDSILLYIFLFLI